MPHDTPPGDGAHAAGWFALHVFLSDAAQADRFLVEWAGPAVRALLHEGHARAWFFLRYWEGGPHLRLRLQGLPDDARQALLARARDAVRSHLSTRPPRREDYYRHHFFDGQPRDPGELPWYDEGSVLVQPYEPEWRRYGGPQGLPVNEALFDLGSTVALGLIRASPGDVARRLTLAASLMPLFAAAWAADIDGVARFLEDYVAYWSASSAQVRDFAAVAAPGTAPTPAQCALLQRQLRSARDRPAPTARDAATLLAAGLEGAVAQWTSLRERGLLVSPVTGRPVADDADHRRSLQAMLASQLHMFNNRLGLAPLQEVALARGLARTARALACQDAEALAA
ncbi:lantibiotic dehydratase C-terminal domain-containing protein [Pseudorhodoferax sp.]|uniref:lantibiotic dehydratase C-terminal domain-containing protein n=1 Tax=Pseudorhodoferax sp. TaxID=1993553 RepID=UPI002DD68947|nr:lantibiotic dehydratase C-terminal domain-containing protein [Pseudorhodoferax sp.]